MLPGIARLVCAITILAGLTGNPLALELFGIRIFGSAEDSSVTEDALPYEATIDVAGDTSKLSGKLKSGSLLLVQQNTPPSGTVGLISRARQDRRNLVGLLYKEGFYGGVVKITIAGQPLETVSVTRQLAPPVDVAISVQTGPLFRFGDIRISGADNIDAASLAADAELVSGEVARSDAVFATERAILAALGRNGYPYPQIADRTIIADHERDAVNVTLDVRSGQPARFGRVEVRGTKQIDPDFVAYVADIPEGAPYSTETLKQSKTRLGKIEALGSVTLRPADSLDPDGSVPVIVEVSERKRRVIGAGAAWSSTEGVKVNTYWKHRNLFGRGELFRIEAGVGRLAESNSIDGLDANFGILLSQPGFFGPATRFDTSFKALQENPDAYFRRAVIGKAVVAYQYSPELELTAGLTGEYSDIDDAQGSNRFGLISLPLGAEYDSRDNRLNPARGLRANAGLEPTVDALNNAAFLKLEAGLASYYALDGEKRFILAGRFGAGSIIGAGRTDIPADRRFLAGGGGSVRGYAYKNIGSGRLNGDAIAGRALLEGSAELRTQWTDTIGSVLFADAGFVGDDWGFSDVGDLKIGVGAGLRYFTPVGPIRLDIGIPLDPDQDDPDFAAYVGIGQAF